MSQINIDLNENDIYYIFYAVLYYIMYVKSLQ